MRSASRASSRLVDQHRRPCARLLGRAQGPQALVGRKVKLTRNPLQGDDVHVALVEEVQPRVEPGPLHQRMDRVDQRVSRWPGV